MDRKKQAFYIPVTVEELPVLLEALYAFRFGLSDEGRKREEELINAVIDKTPKIEEDVPF